MGPDVVERFDNVRHVLDVFSDTLFRLKIEGLEPIRSYGPESKEGEAGDGLVIFDEPLILHLSDPDANRLLVKPDASSDARWADVPVAEGVEFGILERHLAEYSNVLGVQFVRPASLRAISRVSHRLLTMGARLPSVYYHASREYVGMKNSTKKTAFLTLSSVLTILALAAATLGTAHATSATSYSFNLVGPNTAMAQNTIPGTPIAAGDVLRLTGSGAFDLSTSSASGGGSFTHCQPNRPVFPRSLWVVTGFQSFTNYGGPRRGGPGGGLFVTGGTLRPETPFPGD